MLRKENELRLAPSTLARFEQLSQTKGGDAWLQEAQRLGERVVREFGFLDTSTASSCPNVLGSTAQGLTLLRSAVAMCPGDADILTAANYLRFNRCEEGHLCVGDAAPDCVLYHLDQTATTLHTFLFPHPLGAPLVAWPGIRPRRPSISVIIAASLT